MFIDNCMKMLYQNTTGDLEDNRRFGRQPKKMTWTS